MSQYYQSARSYYQKYQTQTQSYARKNKKKQKEKVAFAQSFQDQTDAVFKHLENVLKMLNAGDVFDEDVINLTTDMLIDSINLFAKNCHYCRENKNFDALKLAKKLIIDKWTKFSKKNKKKANKYYEFMMAALDSTKLIQINQERELTAHELKLQKKALSNPKNLNSGFAKIIGSGSRYEKKSAKYYEDKYNQQLETEHSRQLKQYKNNPKYQTDEDDNKQINRDVDDGADSFYFTKSGKQSKFKNAKRRKETDDLDDVLMGGCDNDDDDSKSADSPVDSGDAVAINAVILCNRKNKLGQHWKSSPCLILAKPNKRQSKFHIQMAAPFETEEYWIHPDQFQVSTKEKFVSNVEEQWMAKYGTYLGYDSIEQRNNPNLNEKNAYDNDMCDEDNDEEEEVTINGVIKLSKGNRLGRHNQTMPCLIMAEPNQNERKYHIRLAAPYQKETYWVSPGKYSIVSNNEHFIAKVETQWANYHQVALGYKSMEQKQQEMYPDVY